MPRHLALEPAAVSKTALFMRWLVLVLMAFDMLSAPLHAHAHDMGPDMSSAPLHAGASPAGVAEPDGMPRVDGAVHRLAGHSVAALRTAEHQSTASPALDVIVAGVASLVAALAVPAADDSVGVAWTPADDPIPLACRCPLRPEGRAPPALHS